MAHSLSKRISATTLYYNLIRRVAFPSTSTITIASFLLATLGVGLSFVIAERATSSFLGGAISGLMIFVVPYFLSDIALYSTIMKKDPLFYFRRCLALSLFTMTTWIIILFICSAIALAIPQLIFPDFAIIIGLFSVLPLRAVAIFSMSKTNFVTRTIFTLSEPTLTVLVAIFWFGLAPARMFFGLVLSSLAGLAFAFALITAVEVYGRKAVGFSPIRMFRAFLVDWLEKKNDELESYLSQIGVETEIDVSAFTFRHKESKRVCSIILVSNFHPGPFANVGSSVLPYVFQRVVEERFGASALVPHGISGHELNLVSQEQNARIIGWVLSNLEKATYHDEATCVIRVNNGVATATSQVFDGHALVTMTTSPQDMEDVPYDVGKKIAATGLTHFSDVALVDAHNCLTGPTTMSAEKIHALEETTSASMKDSAKQQSYPFKVSAVRKKPAGFAMKDGIGPGGIAVLAVEANGQRFAYITIDGNNMVKGLREQILETAKRTGFHDAEVMTTDTHMVNGIVHAPLGYRVVGEVIPWSSLLTDIAIACQEAIDSLKPSQVGVISGKVAVTTLGSKSLRQVMQVVYRISKLTSLTLFPMVAILTVISLLLLV